MLHSMTAMATTRESRASVGHRSQGLNHRHFSLHTTCTSCFRARDNGNETDSRKPWTDFESPCTTGLKGFSKLPPLPSQALPRLEEGHAQPPKLPAGSGIQWKPLEGFGRTSKEFGSPWKPLYAFARPRTPLVDLEAFGHPWKPLEALEALGSSWTPLNAFEGLGRPWKACTRGFRG